MLNKIYFWSQMTLKSKGAGAQKSQKGLVLEGSGTTTAPTVMTECIDICLVEPSSDLGSNSDFCIMFYEVEVGLYIVYCSCS